MTNEQERELANILRDYVKRDKKGYYITGWGKKTWRGLADSIETALSWKGLSIRTCNWCKEPLQTSDDLVCGYHHLEGRI